jgi:hypothetical protein
MKTRCRRHIQVKRVTGSFLRASRTTSKQQQKQQQKQTIRSAIVKDARALRSRHATLRRAVVDSPNCAQGRPHHQELSSCLSDVFPSPPPALALACAPCIGCFCYNNNTHVAGSPTRKWCCRAVLSPCNGGCFVHASRHMPSIDARPTCLMPSDGPAWHSG